MSNACFLGLIFDKTTFSNTIYNQIFPNYFVERQMPGSPSLVGRAPGNNLP